MAVSPSFITDDFLLQSKEAGILYHDYAKTMPIIDYHNHLSPLEMAEDRPLENITLAWLKGDHYKWRGMRAHGISEHFITGNASLEDKFKKWAETVPHTIRNPLFHWTQLELKRYFEIDSLLNLDTASDIYKHANSILSQKSPATLLRNQNVELICTTDDPTDDLLYHQRWAQSGQAPRMLPTFRSDALFSLGTDGFLEYLKKLEALVDSNIESYDDLLGAIDARIDYFHDHGCRLSDFGLGGPKTIVEYSHQTVAKTFHKWIEGKSISKEEIIQYQSSLFFHLGRKYHEKGWVQQYHLGAIRNNNTRLAQEIGADVGCDSIGDYSMATFMSQLFDGLDTTNQLAKTITYNLNPSQNEVFATMMGNYNSGGVRGKMQWGSAWWFLDQQEGMENQLNVLSNMGLLSGFVGMLTDSRSFLSFPRHEYFRRILCNLLGEDIRKGLIPNDLPFLGKMVQDICYHNAKAYFNFEDK